MSYQVVLKARVQDSMSAGLVPSPEGCEGEFAPCSALAPGDLLAIFCVSWLVEAASRSVPSILLVLFLRSGLSLQPDVTF